MFKKILLFIFTISMLLQCGYSPMYSSKNGEMKNISINQISFSGDKTINNFLKTNFSKYQKIDNGKTFDLEIETKFYKETLSKDKTAKTTDYKLFSTAIIEVSLSGKFIKNLIISEEKNMSNISDKFEEQKYQRNIKNNFASSLSNKIIIELSLLNDN
tara:strand:- start:95 stop:568 length:474 start_codon:yes stop_codon:yes gene_type:complete